MHFDMHVYLLEKVLLCSFDSKTFAKFAPFLDPKMETFEKWTQKWCQNLTPWGPKMAPKRGVQYSFGIRASESDTVEVPTCDTGFLHEKCFLGVVTPALQLVYAILVRARSFFKFFYAIFFSI